MRPRVAIAPPEGPSRKSAFTSRQELEDYIRHPDIECLECGACMGSLSRHLSTRHQLSPDEYRAKWAIPNRVALSGASVREARREKMNRLRAEGRVHYTVPPEGLSRRHLHPPRQQVGWILAEAAKTGAKYWKSLALPPEQSWSKNKRKRADYALAWYHLQRGKPEPMRAFRVKYGTPEAPKRRAVTAEQSGERSPSVTRKSRKRLRASARPAQIPGTIPKIPNLSDAVKCDVDHISITTPFGKPMTSYQELRSKIAELQSQAEAARKKEIKEAIALIKEKIAAFGLTAEDLGLVPAKAKRGPKTKAEGKKKPGRPAKKAGKGNASKGKTYPPKYQDPASGATWSGQGRSPEWIKAAEAAGKSRESFLIQS